MRTETIFHQEININGKVDELNFQVNANEESSGNIKILIKHGKGNLVKTFSLDEIQTNKQIISVKLSSKITGPIDLYIYGQNINGQIVFKTRSETLLGRWDMNGVPLNGNLLATIKTTIIPRYSYLRIGLLLIMLTVFLYLIHIYKFPEDEREKKLYGIAVVLIFCSICICCPSRTLLAEPRWEVLTNFLHQTWVRKIRDSFFLDDAGYWPLLPRLISIAICKFRPALSYAGIIFSLICLFSIVSLTTEFAKSKYQKFLFTEARFMLVLLMGATCYLDIPSMLYLFNLGYLGILIIILAFMNDLDTLSPFKRRLLFLITILFTSSKPQYIGLIPLMALILILKRKQIGVGKTHYCLTCCIGPFLQIFYLISKVAEDSCIGKNPGFLQSIFETFYTYIQSFLYFFKHFEKYPPPNGLFFNLLISFILLFILIKLIMLHKNNTSIFCLALSLWILGSIFTNSITGRMVQNINISYLLSATSYLSRREEFLSYVGVLFFCIIIISDHFFITYDCNWKKIILSIVLVLCVGRFSQKMSGYLDFEYSTNWKQFSFMAEGEEYAIPVCHEDCFITHNADVYYYGKRDLSKSKVRQSSKVIAETKIDVPMISFLNVDNAIQNSGILSVYVQKRYISQPKDICIVLFDNHGNVLAYTNGLSEYDRSIIGFQFKQKVYGVSYVGFYCKANQVPYELKPEVFITIAHEEHN